MTGRARGSGRACMTLCTMDMGTENARVPPSPALAACCRALAACRPPQTRQWALHGRALREVIRMRPDTSASMWRAALRATALAAAGRAATCPGHLSTGGPGVRGARGVHIAHAGTQRRGGPGGAAARARLPGGGLGGGRVREGGSGLVVVLPPLHERVAEHAVRRGCLGRHPAPQPRGGHVPAPVLLHGGRPRARGLAQAAPACAGCTSASRAVCALACPCCCMSQARSAQAACAVARRQAGCTRTDAQSALPPLASLCTQPGCSPHAWHPDPSQRTAPGHERAALSAARALRGPHRIGTVSWKALELR